MSAIAQPLADYLAVRRALGYKLVRPGKLLAQFLEFLHDAGAPTITTELALRWATLPRPDQRLLVVQQALDGSRVRRASAHDRSGLRGTAGRSSGLPALAPHALHLHRAEILALMAASAMLRTPHRAVTYRPLIGLLSVTGMRIGEAIRLDRGDIDTQHALLIFRDSKFGKSRQLPLHPSTTDALRHYLRRGDRPTPTEPTAAVFVSSAGTRLLYCAVQHTFAGLAGPRRHAGAIGGLPAQAA